MAVDVNEMTRNYMDSIFVEQRLVGAMLPEIGISIFGEKFLTPIMTPAFSHLGSFGNGRESGMVEYARAAKNVGALNWVGMETDEGFAEILSSGAKTVRIIKPFAEQEKIAAQIAFAEKNGAFAVGIDIDHVFGYDGRYDVVDGQQMGPITEEDIKDYVKSTKLPFVIKGVLGVEDAKKCAACGVKGIVVSHHHGRMPFAVPPLMILPRIKEALAGTGVSIFVDCHIDSGVDAFKALALGADAVSVGRAMMEPLQKEGVKGVEDKIHAMNNELITMMAYTGFTAPDKIESSVLHFM